MNKAATILLLICYFFTSCKDKTELGNGYYFLPDYEAFDVGIPEGAILYKSTSKYSIHDVLIKNKVIDVDFNHNHIIAVQRKCENLYDKNGNVEKMNYWCDKYLSYYIIEKKGDKLHGPFNSSEFNEYRKKLKVSEELELELHENKEYNNI